MGFDKTKRFLVRYIDGCDEGCIEKDTLEEALETKQFLIDEEECEFVELYDTVKDRFY